MTQNKPTAAQLIGAVKAFLEHEIKPELRGHKAFNLMVALKSLDIVQRELELGPAFAAAERGRLVAILGHDGSLADLNAEFARRLRDRELGIDDPGVAQHLRATTLEKLAIDQPQYSGYAQARARHTR